MGYLLNIIALIISFISLTINHGNTKIVVREFVIPSTNPVPITSRNTNLARSFNQNVSKMAIAALEKTCRVIGEKNLKAKAFAQVLLQIDYYKETNYSICI